MQSLRDWLSLSLQNVQTPEPLWGTPHKGYCRPSLRDEEGQILAALDRTSAPRSDLNSYKESGVEDPGLHGLQNDPTSIINEVRQNVDLWRALPSLNQWQVTPETARLLQHWRHYKFSGIRPFFCQVEAVETAIWVPDYLAWAVQRVFERGETRHYDFMRERISLVVDLYDAEKHADSRNYYTPKRPLTAENKLGPPVS